MPRRLARLLGAGQFRRERGELLMAGPPKAAQLIKYESPESGIRIGEEVAQRVQLLLNAYGCSFLLLQAVAQEVKLILEIRVGLLQAGAVLEELHEPLFIGAHTARVQTSFEKTQSIDQIPA